MGATLDRRRFLSAACAATLSGRAQTRRRRPNFIILFADDMGYGDLACYGHPTLRTPNLDRMAEEGARLTSFYSAAPVCTPSRVGLLTGRYPVRAGQPNNLGPDSVGGLRLTEKTIAQVLKEQGYRTAAIGKWHLGHNPPEYLPTARGFDSYLGLLYSNDMIPPFVKTEKPLELFRDARAIEPMTDQSGLTERYTAEAIRFIRSAGTNPFFLYLPYAMPHLPISASSRKGTSRAGLYGDVIETLDWSAGEILRTLREQGVDGDTMVVFTSDNGPWNNLPPRMLQKGNQPWHTGTKNLLRGAKGTTWEGGQRVPCIVRWPGVIPGRQAPADMASTLDLFATLASAAGAALPSDRVYDSYDLMPFLKGEAPSPRREFFYFRGRTLEAVREGKWKFRHAREVRGEGQPGGDLRMELFDLDTDPAEQYDQYPAQRPLGDRLHARLKAFAEELKADLPG